MSRRVLAYLGSPVAGVALVALASIPLTAQTAPKGDHAPAGRSTSATAPSGKHWTPPRTPWGDPDLEGVWDYKTITPLERPQSMAGRQFLTDEEVNQLESRAAKRLDEPPDDTVPAGTVHAPYWTDPGRKVLEDKRTSLIIDPADGRVPSLTPEAQMRAATRGTGNRQAGGGKADSYTDRSNLERCITQGLPNANLPTLYNNNIQIFQSPGYVAILHEMVHDVRVVPLDGRAHVGSGVRQWLGDSRGHWDGSTLVVETTNFSDKTNFRGSGANLHLVERFTRVGPDTIGYEVTMNDPTTWTRPWTAALPMRPAEGLIYEYACHESNIGLYDILEVARDEDKAAAARK
jgi:hypothetical protein